MLLSNYMSACIQMSNNHDNDKIFNDYMSGDSEISRRYREESNEEPPKHLIDATQNLIEEMMDADMDMAAKKPRKWWYVPLSLAASFVICVGVVLSILRTSDESIVMNEMVAEYEEVIDIIVEVNEVAEDKFEPNVLQDIEISPQVVSKLELVEEQDSRLTNGIKHPSVKLVTINRNKLVMDMDLLEMLSLPEAELRDSGLTYEMENEILNRNIEELEQFELDNLRMVGTVEDENNLWGIILDPDGVVHRIKVGNYMGRNTGKILNVFEDRIEVREIVRNSQGRWEERQTGIALSDNYDAEKIESRQK